MIVQHNLPSKTIRLVTQFTRRDELAGDTPFQASQIGISYNLPAKK
jgi:hypothetical protein